MNEQFLDLRAIDHRRFSQTAAYRNRVWQELTASFFGCWVRPDAAT